MATSIPDTYRATWEMGFNGSGSAMLIRMSGASRLSPVDRRNNTTSSDSNEYPRLDVAHADLRTPWAQLVSMLWWRYVVW